MEIELKTLFIFFIQFFESETKGKSGQKGYKVATVQKYTIKCKISKRRIEQKKKEDWESKRWSAATKGPVASELCFRFDTSRDTRAGWFVLSIETQPLRWGGGMNESSIRMLVAISASSTINKSFHPSTGWWSPCGGWIYFWKGLPHI